MVTKRRETFPFPDQLWLQENNKIPTFEDWWKKTGGCTDSHSMSTDPKVIAKRAWVAAQDNLIKRLK